MAANYRTTLFVGRQKTKVHQQLILEKSQFFTFFSNYKKNKNFNKISQKSYLLLIKTIKIFLEIKFYH